MYVGARVAFLCATVAACGQEPAAPISAQRTMDRACSAGSNISLASAQSTVVDCSNGGTTATLAAGGASYLVVAQLATGSAAPGLVAYTLSTDAGAAATSAASHSAAPVTPAPAPPLDRQLAFDLRLRERERRAAQSPAFASAALRAPAFELGVSSAVAPVTGSVRDFRVLSNYASATDSWRTVAARLEYAGANLLLYVDTLTPHAGFSAAALQQYGQYFDQTLYPMDAGAFGQPADVDGNGRVIMLMSPVVNAGTPAASCYTQGYVAGFFNGQDFNGASDPNSNRGEIFYSIVADPQGSYGCAHSVADVSSGEPAVFLHELQHLISYSQHVVVHGGKPAAGWMDEGLSLVAEELGSRYYEARCPAPACRSTPGQLFPDSSAGFVRNFLLTSYAFASHPDSNSLTLHDDGDFGLAWRGGEWAFMRWLGDHMPDGFYRSLESGSADGIAAIRQLRTRALHRQSAGSAAQHGAAGRQVRLAQSAGTMGARGESVRVERAAVIRVPDSGARRRIVGNAGRTGAGRHGLLAPGHRTRCDRGQVAIHSARRQCPRSGAPSAARHLPAAAGAVAPGGRRRAIRSAARAWGRSVTRGVPECTRPRRRPR